jgi:hypothetical protein
MQPISCECAMDVGCMGNATNVKVRKESNKRVKDENNENEMNVGCVSNATNVKMRKESNKKSELREQ